MSAAAYTCFQPLGRERQPKSGPKLFYMTCSLSHLLVSGPHHFTHHVKRHLLSCIVLTLSIIVDKIGPCPRGAYGSVEIHYSNESIQIRIFFGFELRSRKFKKLLFLNFLSRVTESLLCLNKCNISTDPIPAKRSCS